MINNKPVFAATEFGLVSHPGKIAKTVTSVSRGDKSLILHITD